MALLGTTETFQIISNSLPLGTVGKAILVPNGQSFLTPHPNLIPYLDRSIRPPPGYQRNRLNIELI